MWSWTVFSFKFHHSVTDGQTDRNALYVDCFIYIHYAAPPYSVRISVICLLPFGKVWFGSVCRVQRLATKQNAKIYEGWVKSYFNAFVDQNSRNSQTFRLVISISEALPWIRVQNLRRVGKIVGPITPIWSRLWTKVHVVLQRCRRPLLISNALDWYIMFRYEDIRREICRKVVKSSKKVVLCPRFVGGGNTTHFVHVFSNRIYFRACGRSWLSSVQRAQRVAGEKEDRQIAARGKT